jgi:DNA-binding response OmpR family regulator
MIADDDDLFSAAVQLKLASEGYHVDAFGNGKDLMDHLTAHAPDAVLLDLKMPVLSGLDVLVHIQQDPQLSSIPVLVVTSQRDRGTRARCLGLGAAGFYPKPVSLRTLAAGVRACLS